MFENAARKFLDADRYQDNLNEHFGRLRGGNQGIHYHQLSGPDYGQMLTDLVEMPSILDSINKAKRETAISQAAADLVELYAYMRSLKQV